MLTETTDLLPTEPSVEAVTPNAMARPVSAAPTSSGAGHAPSPTNPNRSWYALVVRSNWAFKVQDRLENLGFETFLPTYAVTRRWSDRTKIFLQPLFPGYLFARFDFSTETTPIFELPGIVQTLPTKLDPTPIADSEISDLKIVLASNLPSEPCSYEPGEKVTVHNGPLAGVEGTVLYTRNHQMRVVVGVEMFGKGMSVTVDAADVRKEA